MECSGTMHETRKCTTCNGVGWIAGQNSKGEPEQEQCEPCHGTGDENATVPCCMPVRWVRSTQFAGNHPYCDDCAKQESDFGKEDSYTYWKEIKE